MAAAVGRGASCPVTVAGVRPKNRFAYYGRSHSRATWCSTQRRIHFQLRRTRRRLGGGAGHRRRGGTACGGLRRYVGLGRSAAGFGLRCVRNVGSSGPPASAGQNARGSRAAAGISIGSPSASRVQPRILRRLGGARRPSRSESGKPDTALKGWRQDSRHSSSNLLTTRRDRADRPRKSSGAGKVPQRNRVVRAVLPQAKPVQHRRMVRPAQRRRVLDELVVARWRRAARSCRGGTGGSSPHALRSCWRGSEVRPQGRGAGQVRASR